jgi:outer membrane protein OmpA-like peptidoglycan-associated protein
MRLSVRCSLLLSSLVLAMPAFAQEEEEELVDTEGSKDHPAVKRYPGSVISQFDQREFEAFDFPLADHPESERDPRVKTKKVEGRYHRADYLFPPKASCTQVLRNYENAFKAAGLTMHSGKEAPGDMGWGTTARWVSAEGRARGKGGTLFILQTCDDQNGAGDRAGGLLVVVEQNEMEQKVEIDAGAMADEIEKSGRIALYGINFATNKADVTPDSAKTLEQIAELLRNRPEWKLRIEGHTDNVGNAKSNLALSKKRAAAVKDHLVKKLKVDGKRLTTEGYGDTRPLAPNTDEAGRAKNRRVELSKL